MLEHSKILESSNFGLLVTAAACRRPFFMGWPMFKLLLLRYFIFTLPSYILDDILNVDLHSIYLNFFFLQTFNFPLSTRDDA